MCGLYAELWNDYFVNIFITFFPQKIHPKELENQ